MLQVTDTGVCLQVTDKGLCTLSGSCQSLAFLVLSGVNNITDKSIFCIANNCPYLQEIYLNGCKQISSTTLQYLKVINLIQHSVYQYSTDYLNYKDFMQILIVESLFVFFWNKAFIYESSESIINLFLLKL